MQDNVAQKVLFIVASDRLNLEEIANNVSNYRVKIENDGKVILEPYAEIPLSVKWIFENKELMSKIKEEVVQKQKV